MQDTLNQIVQDAAAQAPALAQRADFEGFKARIVGPNGSLTQAMKGIGKLPPDQRPMVGKLVNEAKKALEEIFATTLARIEGNELAARLGPAIDPSLPSPDAPAGTLHPLTQVLREAVAMFRKIGFTVAEGPEVETDWFCFDALNTPADHPARDAQDTLFLPASTRMANVSKHADEPHILRTHTSSVQIRTMLKEKPPLRIIAPGRVFRRDTTDATHSANFHQIEGLYVDRNVSVKDLKAVLDHLVRELFGRDVKTRLRPSFFPFTEPSFELDLNAPNLGRLSNRWIEVAGCGLVDPEVFKAVGYDPAVWTGYAFGIGVERIAMIRLGIDDIRHFYQNDLRFLRQFA